MTGKHFLTTTWVWLVVVVLVSLPQACFAYDERNQTTAAYDSKGHSGGGYDADFALPTPEKKDRTTECRVPFAKFHDFLAADSKLSGTALAGQLGQAGGDEVGITGPKTAIEIPGTGQIRIPDALTGTKLTEVKNVGSLSYTQQIRYFSTYSQANGLNFELWVRLLTELLGLLQQAISNGQITPKIIP